MNIEEKIKNECFKIYDDVIERITLLTPLINKLKDSDKNTIDKKDISQIRELSIDISLRCNDIKEIINVYDDVENRIKQLKRYWDMKQN